MAIVIKKKPRPRITPETADLSDPLWSNAHLRRFFRCGATALCALKKQPGFPKPARAGGLQRYPADQVKAYAVPQTTTPDDTQGATQ